MSFLTRWLGAPDPPYEPPETRDWTINDPYVRALFGNTPNLAGVSVSELTVLGIPAVFRAVSTIANSVASLPLHTIQERPDGTRRRVASVLDDPGRAVGMTASEWKRLVLVHLLVHGNCFLIHIPNGAGALAGLQPVHPSLVGIEVRKGRKIYRVSMDGGQVREFTDYQGGRLDGTLTHIPALGTDGVRGLSPLQLGRNMFGTAIAAENSAAKMFSDGALIKAIAQWDDSVTSDEAEVMEKDLQRKIAGTENAGGTAFVNRGLTITPVSLSMEDAQWIQARAFQIEEIARWFGVPPHKLAQTEKQTSWGTGIAEQNQAMAREVLEPWTTSIQERLSWLLPNDRKAEFLYAAFIEPDFETETDLLIKQVGGPIMLTNEARKIRNLPPLPGGDVLASGKTPEVSTDGD
ncbi:phage portal protein [Mycolicibacterium septicum]|uniref:Phage portal protein n=1 Tax=Mycolicibacterium septicum TaxID=98668 RepID=A0ABW9LRN1_9MYCO